MIKRRKGKSNRCARRKEKAEARKELERQEREEEIRQDKTECRQRDQEWRQRKIELQAQMKLLNKLMEVKEVEPDSDHDMMKLTDKDDIEVCWMMFERLMAAVEGSSHTGRS